jgi:hypothetical protein
MKGKRAITVEEMKYFLEGKGLDNIPFFFLFLTLNGKSAEFPEKRPFRAHSWRQEMSFVTLLGDISALQGEGLWKPI